MKRQKHQINTAKLPYKTRLPDFNSSFYISTFFHFRLIQMYNNVSPTTQLIKCKKQSVYFTEIKEYKSIFFSLSRLNIDVGM
jgi:hypothetical protein